MEVFKRKRKWNGKTVQDKYYTGRYALSLNAVKPMNPDKKMTGKMPVVPY